MSYYGNAGNATGGGGGSSGGGFYGGQQQQQQQPQQQQGGFSAGGSTNMQQWQAQPQQQQQQPQQQQPHQRQQQQQYGMQQQQPQQQSFFGSTNAGAPGAGGAAGTAAAAPSLWNPAAAATLAAAAGSLASGSGMSNDAMFNIGEKMFQEGTARMIPGLETTMMSLRSYFAVDNQYVVVKMKKLLFPFLSKVWKRQQSGTKYTPDGIAVAQYDLPIMDENAPDLYLPSMSLITYVLLCALCYGNAGQFNPEVIPDVTTKCLVTQVLEVLCIRFGFYMMQLSSGHGGTPTMLDLCSYTGYKYLGLCVNMMMGLLVSHFGFGIRAFYVTFLWTATAASFAMLKIMANNIPLQTHGPKREVMVLVFGASQFATMWFVSQTKFL